MQTKKIQKDSYKEIYDNWEWNVPEEYNFGFDVVDKKAEDRTKLALISIHKDGKDDTKHTFFDLKRQSNKFANALRNNGAKKGDRALVILQSIPEWYEALIGMFKLGVIPMPGTVLLREKDIKYRINRAEANIVITDKKHAEIVDKLRDECPTLEHFIIVRDKKEGWLSYEEEMEKASHKLSRDEIETTKSDDPMLIYFTSGTTGHPKMVLHSHKYPLGHEVTARFAQDLNENDLHLTMSETGWAKAAWGKLFGQMIVGATILQAETPGRFDPDFLLRMMEKYGVTTFCAPPTVYRMLIQQDLSKYDLTLRHSMSAGEPLNPEVIKKWKEAFGLEIYEFYGQTESVCLISNYPYMELKYGSMGKPTPGFDVRVVDDEGNEKEPNEVGSIAVNIEDGKPPGLFEEYWKDDDIMDESFRSGYYYTGDQAYRDKDGYFWFVGRDDDVIKSSGYRIGPFEVESALIEHDSVAECAVVGVPDPEGVRGTVVKAYVVLTKDYEPSEDLTKELQNHVKEVTAPYKYPRIIEYKEELPKTISGKILRRKLRKE
ncbi:MAG: AMP-binding protein [Candidatus Thermoplasmatota archaeon]